MALPTALPSSQQKRRLDGHLYQAGSGVADEGVPLGPPFHKACCMASGSMVSGWPPATKPSELPPPEAEAGSASARHGGAQSLAFCPCQTSRGRSWLCSPQRASIWSGLPCSLEASLSLSASCRSYHTSTSGPLASALLGGLHVSFLEDHQAWASQGPPGVPALPNTRSSPQEETASEKLMGHL